MKHPLKAWIIRTVLLLSLALAVTPNIQAQSQASTYTLDQVISKLDQVGRTFRTMEAAIERTKVTVLVNDKSTDSGKMYIARAGNSTRLKIDFTLPAQQSVLIDKGKILLYYPKLKQAQEYTSQNSSKAASGFLIPGLGQSAEEIKRDYETKLLGSEMVSGQKTTMLELTPKSAKFAAQFKSIVLWLDEQKWTPLQMRHNEASGDYQIMKFSNIKTNAGLSNSVFNLKIPNDVKISKQTF